MARTAGRVVDHRRAADGHGRWIRRTDRLGRQTDGVRGRRTRGPRYRPGSVSIGSRGPTDHARQRSSRDAVKIAIFTVTLPEWTPEEAVRNLAELGYDGVEWRIADDPPRARPGFWQGNRCTFPLSTFVEDAPRIRALTDAAGLEIPAIASYVQAADVDNVQRVLRGTAALGTPIARIQVPRYEGQAGYVELWERARRDYQEVARLARAHGAKALVEIHH